jgi:hypothetical protein
MRRSSSSTMSWLPRDDSTRSRPSCTTSPLKQRCSSSTLAFIARSLLDQGVWASDAEWDRYSKLEALHQRIQARHEVARRELECTRRQQVNDLMHTWQLYKQVIEELDRTSSLLEELGNAAIASALAPPVSGASQSAEAGSGVESSP